MKKSIKSITIAVILATTLTLFTPFIFSGCSEADKVNANLSKQANYFECERRITVYNARTDTIILEAEGYLSISNNANDELVVTVKTGPNEYKKNYIYLNDYTLAIINKIIDFVWSDCSVNNTKEIEVVNMDSNIVNNMYMAKVIRDKLNIIAERLGC